MRADRVYDLLASDGNPAVDPALLAGLEGAESPYRQRIIQTLLKRRTKVGLVGIVAQYHTLDASCRHLLAGTAPLFQPVWRLTSRDRSLEPRTNTVAMILDLDDVPSGYLLTAALHDGWADTRRAGAAGLLEFSRRYTLERDQALAALEAGDPEAYGALRKVAQRRSHLLRAISEGLTSYASHRCREVAWAFVLVADEFPPTIWNLVDRLGSVVTYALLGLLDESGHFDHLESASLLLGGLHSDWLRPRLLRILADISEVEHFESVAKRWALLADDAVRHAVRGLKTQRFLLRCDEKTFCALSPEAQVQALRLAACTGLSEDHKRDLYRIALVGGGVAAQLEAVWQFCNGAGTGPIPTLRWVLSKTDGRARQAALDALRRFEAAGVSR